MDRDELLARAKRPAEDALRLHPVYRGKVQIAPKVPIRDASDFAIWYTPGVAAPCKAIQATPDLVWEHTNRANLIAVVSDATRILGLGDIGPEAGLPVMEGKALLFKLLGGVDAVPLCLRTKDPDELVRAVELLEPSFGGVNLEDISQPKCFRVLDALRGRLAIPVWHDDQQGTATVMLAALWSALRVVGKELARVRIAMVGMGAANVATYRLLASVGVPAGAIVACDRVGTLHPGRHDVEAQRTAYADKWKVCQESNADRIRGGLPEALRGADVCIAFSSSGPGVIRPEWVRTMAKDAIVFACANPVPEIWPWEAKEAGARIVCTGRSDFPNQVNNSLGFPAIFRGALDVRARAISDGMAIAAARALTAFAEARGAREDDLMPRMDEWELFPRIAAATGAAACDEGLARVVRTREALEADARERIRGARALLEVLMGAGVIAQPPGA
ncbi:MAG TPA: malate dehydrogenase [Deltaproteobacteria bacterium]|jgi:malate dehydrogenase (oxaloacetate-decarboxylating)|nr:malate dehydrogenase [Deltaproteobacteria bacterium]